jgi:hypothetical protein
MSGQMATCKVRWRSNALELQSGVSGICCNEFANNLEPGGKVPLGLQRQGAPGSPQQLRPSNQGTVVCVSYTQRVPLQNGHKAPIGRHECTWRHGSSVALELLSSGEEGARCSCPDFGSARIGGAHRKVSPLCSNHRVARIRTSGGCTFVPT